MNITCKICKKSFKVRQYRIKIAKYCSMKCYGISKKGRTPHQANSARRGKPAWNAQNLTAKCKVCNKIFKIPKYRQDTVKYCSYKCSWEDAKGKHRCPENEFKKGKVREKACNWKGGIVKKDGYIEEYCPNHPYISKGRIYIRQHRLVVEKHIKRFLKPTEQVHHINGIKNDNRPNNLMAFKNRSAHIRFEKGFEIKPEEIIFDGRLL